MAATAHDQMLYCLVAWAMEETGRNSVTGLDIARLAGSDSVIDIARELVAEEREYAEGANSGLFVVQHTHLVTRYLTPHRTPGRSGITLEAVIDLAFGKDSAGMPYATAGWSGPENGFVWSNAKEVVLRLPPLPGKGAYVVRLIGNPFTVRPAVPHQDVGIAINGQEIGSVTIDDYCMIEFDLPPSLTLDDTPLEITLRLPKAARPRELNHAEDNRLLGFCLRRVTVSALRATPP